MAQTVKTHTPQTLKQGSKGEAVKGLQNALRVRGHHIGIDGVFGSGTKDAVLQFQHDVGLVGDGIVGPNTWGSLCVHLVQRGHTLSGSRSSSSPTPRAGPRSSTSTATSSPTPTASSPARCSPCRSTPAESRPVR